MVTCSGTCRKFMDNWVSHVPLILKFAVRTKKRNDAVSKVFQTYEESDILNSFETQASIALEILPLLIPVKNRKGVVAVNYLYYVEEDSVSLEAVLKETLNRPPFILNIGDSFHIIVDNQVLLTSNSLCDALLNMFAAYYVFSIAYSPQVKHALLFIQSVILGLEDEHSKKSPVLKMFVKNLEVVKASQALSKTA
ncbi:hypothetical protein DAPPUDRAFT_344394 [Daphnia pulex]|uniref:Uncharacterized protein n=1 Tax=Daphnia pulex TaxID=6669 RepID=E9I6X6_DAPPU|nr:hypothetical protein DAPPUDRAFT_344394 [Daphnia pulex]|eukprot:EFX60254.1 hypothetical protein DAPPUDRAFT_344394 [Daphnia pulex]